MALLTTVRVRGYRSARDVQLRLGLVTALVGEARSGKSNLLWAIRTLLDPAAPPGREDLRGRAEHRRCRGAARRRPADRPHGPAARTSRASRRGAPPVALPPGVAPLRPAARPRRRAPTPPMRRSAAFAPLLERPGRAAVRLGRRLGPCRGDRCLPRGRRHWRRPPDRGARALPAAADAALPLPAPARARCSRQPGALLDARARAFSTSRGSRSSSSFATAPGGARTSSSRSRSTPTRPSGS